MYPSGKTNIDGYRNWYNLDFVITLLKTKIEFCIISGEEGVGGGGTGGVKQRHNSSDKNIREYFSKHPSSSPVRHTGAKSPSPQGANYPMVTSFIYIAIAEF